MFLTNFFILICFCITGFCSDIPVIFIHRGDSDYLEHSLWQAKQYNDDVILIGDSTNNHFEWIRHFDMNNYFREAELFANDYVHLSSNVPSFELFCIQRWYVLKEFVNRQKIDRFFYCDSDVMVYCDISQEFNHADCDVALPNIEGYSGHNSFWSMDALNHFCHFTSLFYGQKENISLWEYYYRYRRGNAICDMTLLTEFVRALGQPEMIEGTIDKNRLASEKKIGDLMGNPMVKVARLLTSNTVFDLCNIGHSELGAYQIVAAFNTRIKSIRWINNQPYCYNHKTDRLLRFNTLHCQGEENKRIMKFLRREKN